MNPILSQMHRSASITDSPSYFHRGIMVDTSRHFVPVPVLARVLDGMAASKMNHFHWHITDAVSFPLYLPSVPQLSRYGAYSPDRVYMPEDVKFLVEYAAARGIKVVPEVDMPRHAANGWQFGPGEGLGDLALCVNEFAPRCRGGICGHLNPVNPNTYDVLEKVFADLSSLFPSTDSAHMGADEVEFTCWRKSPEVRGWMEERGMDPDGDDDMFDLWSQFQENATMRLRKAWPRVSNITLWTSTLTERADLSKRIPASDHVIQVWDSQ